MSMGYITVWACGDLCAAVSACAQLRLLGCKARVHDPQLTSDRPAPWRHGPQVVVGDGNIPHFDDTGASDLLVMGEAACNVLKRMGSKLTRRPPGLVPRVRTLTCRRHCGMLGPRNTHFPVDAIATSRDVLDVPKRWQVEAVEPDGRASVIVGIKSVLCMFMPRGPSLVSILDKVTRHWGLHRSDPGERALHRAITTASDHVPRGGTVVLGYSGGLTSCVSAHVLRKAIGPRVTACFVWTGLENTLVREGVTPGGVKIVMVDARQRTLDRLAGTTGFAERRRLLMRVFRDACTEAYPGAALSQGATYEALLMGVGGPALGTPGLVQPLEGLFREEVVLIAKEEKLAITAAAGPPSGFADCILGPFSAEALRLCRTTDATLMRQLADANTPTPGVRARHTFTVDVWDSRRPRVCFGYEESHDGMGWRRMRLRDDGLDMVVEALRSETNIPDLAVLYDVSLPLE